MDKNKKKEQIPDGMNKISTYMKIADKRLGLLINFNAPLIKENFYPSTEPQTFSEPQILKKSL